MQAVSGGAGDNNRRRQGNEKALNRYVHKNTRDAIRPLVKKHRQSCTPSTSGDFGRRAIGVESRTSALMWSIADLIAMDPVKS
jgi:hypothetical protein